MKKLTKKQRHEIYKKALERLMTGATIGICPNISAIAFNSVLFYDRVTKESFPELYLFEPKTWATRVNWVHDDDDFIRETILMFCIEMTK